MSGGRHVVIVVNEGWGGAWGVMGREAVRANPVGTVRLVPEHDDDDSDASGPPPDPLDRVWLHPSELHSFLATPESRPRAARPRRTALVGLALVGALAIAIGLVVALTDVVDDDNGAPLATGVDVFSTDRVPPEMVFVAGASVVTVQVARADGTTKASGVCIEDGVVLTSAHALDGATAVTVATGQERHPAEAAGADPGTDLALLRVDALEVPPARLGSSERLREGEWVLGLAAGAKADQHWVSVGAISAFDRLFVSPSGAVVAGLIDTETGAGRPHSGGVVLDARGAVVGILTVPAGSAPSGLAVPIDTARDVAQQLATTGTAAHGWLGLSGTDDTESAGGGARVVEVHPSSPAERAGLADGDVIIAVADGQVTVAVPGIRELMTEVTRRRPGNSLELTVLRDGAKRRLAVALGKQATPDAADTVATSTTVPTAGP
jgi:S1-C subfamily serine protease